MHSRSHRSRRCAARCRRHTHTHTKSNYVQYSQDQVISYSPNSQQKFFEGTSRIEQITNQTPPPWYVSFWFLTSLLIQISSQFSDIHSKTTHDSESHFLESLRFRPKCFISCTKRVHLSTIQAFVHNSRQSATLRRRWCNANCQKLDFQKKNTTLTVSLCGLFSNHTQ